MRNRQPRRLSARRRVPHFAFEYVEGGAEDEASLRGNRASFESLHFVPQTLVDTSSRSLRTDILGRPAPAPLIIGPTGHPDVGRLQGFLRRNAPPHQVLDPGQVSCARALVERFDGDDR